MAAAAAAASVTAALAVAEAAMKVGTTLADLAAEALLLEEEHET